MRKQICYIVILFLCLSFNALAKNNLKAMSEPFTMISTIKIDDSKVDGAIDLLSELQLSTLENEDGCIIFDVLLGDDDPTLVFIYESYVDEAAYDKHIKNKHYNTIFVTKLKPMVKDLKTTKVFPLNFESGYSDAEI